MSQDSAATERKPIATASAPRDSRRSPRARGGPRLVEAGDTLARPGPKAAEADRVARRTSSTQTTQALAIGDLLAKGRRGQPPNEVLRQLQALIAGASPDEVRSLRKTLFRADAPRIPEVDPDTALSKGWREGAYPYLNLLSRKSYERQKYRLQVELLKLQAWVKETGQRVVIVFEGRDAAGKGGAIKRFMEHLNPRGARVVALEKPSEVERGQWYFQRYVQHLPTRGEIVLFDRSWYNRAGVERVMGFCTDKEAEAFLAAVPEFERQLVDDGILLIKYWLCCDQAIQEERFENRLNNPMKRWKLSPIDSEARKHYDDYTDAREEMLKKTHTGYAPWTLIDFNDQPLGRLTLLRDLLDRLPDTDLPLAEIDWPPLRRKPSKERYGVLKPIPDYARDEHVIARKHGHHHRHSK